MSTYGNDAGGGQSSRLYQAQSLLKNSIRKANVSTGKTGTSQEKKSLMGSLFGAAFSGIIYVISLIVIGALVFIYLL